MNDLLRRVFASTLAALDPARSMQRAIDTMRFEAGESGRWLVLAYGKAARGMAQALLAGLPQTRFRGLVVTPAPDDAPLPPFEVIAAGHPLPDANSLRAGQLALELARGVTPDEHVLFLASGGGSALLEWPIDGEATLDEVRRLYAGLVASGADIVAINTVRKHFSAVKGGRLALAASRAQTHLTALMIDVPLRESSSVASGPSCRDSSTREDCIRVLDRFDLWSLVPARLAKRLRSGDLPPCWDASHGVGRDLPMLLQYEEIGSNEIARAAAMASLRAAGVLAIDDPATDDWPYERAASHLLARLDRLRRHHPGRTVAIVAGGELSVPLPPSPGTGGRNQQFALACARRIRGRPITVLSCGTDGIDGNSRAAGAIVDGATMARARRAGFDVHDALRRCDAFPLLHALGDTVITGPTGTNVRDLRILVFHR